MPHSSDAHTLAEPDLVAYAEALRWEQHRSGRGGWRDRLPAPLRLRLKLWATRAMRSASVRKFEALRSAAAIRLDLGSGFVRDSGWIGVDLAGTGAAIVWDLTTPLPLPAGSVDAIRLIHVVEHFDLGTTHALLSEARRLLRDDGTLEVAVPDLARYVADYVEPAGFLDSCRGGRPTRALAMQEVFYLYGHRVMYDFETLEAVARRAGFGEVRQADADERREMLGDEPSREMESLAVVCRP